MTTPDRRVWYSHVKTGDLGWMVVQDGEKYIRLDRPNQEILKPFRPALWREERAYRPLTRHQLAVIAFEADKKLCLALGLQDKARKDWLNLTADERIAWMDHGPTKPAERATLYKAIMDAVGPLAR